MAPLECLLTQSNHLVHQAQLQRTFGVTPAVALGELVELLGAQVAVLGQELVQLGAHGCRVLRRDLDIGLLCHARAAHKLVDEHLRVAIHLAVVAAGQDHRGHRGHDALAHRDHGTVERLHGVDERQPRRNAATWAVDDEGDGLGRVLVLQHQQGLDEAVAGHVVDLAFQQ